MKILVLNCGSSSLKFQLIDMESNERIAKGNFERIGGMKTTLKLNVRGNKEELLHIARDYDEAIAFVLEVLLKPEYNLIQSLEEISAVGHRIVHGGEMFSHSVLIDDTVISEIEMHRFSTITQSSRSSRNKSCKISITKYTNGSSIWHSISPNHAS